MEIQHNQIYNEDCLQFMKQLPDNYFDLIITDPPYGIGIDKWDKEVPSKEVFDEIFRVSKNQIIFGGNYFQLPHTESWICWDKTYRYNQGLEIGEFELIWTSFKHKAKFCRYTSCGNFQGFENPKANYNKKPNSHPTQKPEPVARWLLKLFAKEGDLIFDPFAGSGSFLVACKQLGFNYVGCEINKDYVEICKKRLAQQSVDDFTSATPTLAKPKEFNMDLTATATPTPKCPSDTSLNPNIQRNLRGLLQSS